MKWPWKKEEKKWNEIVKPEDSSGYYWRHVREGKWRLWSPKHEYVGTALDRGGILDFHLGGMSMSMPADWQFDADKGTWKTKVIVKILNKIAEDKHIEALLAKTEYNPDGEV